MHQLTTKAINAINEARENGIIRLLIDALGCSENSVNRHIRDNIPNGDLTKYAALEVIRQVTGLGDDKILKKVTTVKNVA